MPYPPRATGDNPYGPQVQFRTEDVLPPTALYLSMDDTLVVQFINAAAPTTGTATIRMLLADGTLKVDYYQVVPSTINNFYSYAVIPPVEGYLLSALIQVNSTLDGSCWCQMVAFKGTVTQPIVSLPPVSGLLVLQGYVDQASYLAWPNSPVAEAGTGAGRIRNIPLTAAAGAAWKLQTTSNQRWEVIAVMARLVTSAVVANRQVMLLAYDRIGNIVSRLPTNFNQAASLTWFYSFYNSAAHVDTPLNVVTAPLPQGLQLDPVMSLQGFVNFMDPGDQWGPVNCLVKEWMGVGHA